MNGYSQSTESLDSTEGYIAVVETARSIATMNLDGVSEKTGEPVAINSTIDPATRDAARSFLRSEFGRWAALDVETSDGGES